MSEAALKTNPDIELPLAPGTAVAVSAPEQETGNALVVIIERALSDPRVDIEKLERLTALYERLQAATAKRAYIGSLKAVQGKLPVINRKGRIEIRDKTEQRNIIQSTKYALWEDIHEAIRPILEAEGFVLSFRTGSSEDGRITVTAVLSHSLGHEESTTMTLPFDSTGSKNSVQAIGSSTSYGKRYTATSLLNLVSRGEDDDGKSAGGAETINEKQIARIQAKIVEAGADIALFCDHMGVGAITEIQAKNFKKAITALDAKINSNKQKGTKKK